MQGSLFETKSSSFLDQDFKVSLKNEKSPADRPSRGGCKVVTQVGSSFSFLWKADLDLCVSKNDEAVIY